MPQIHFVAATLLEIVFIYFLYFNSTQLDIMWQQLSIFYYQMR